LKVYKDVAITSIPVARDSDTGDSLTFQISFRQVNVVKLQEIEIEAKVNNLDTNANRQASPAFNAGRT